MLKHTSSCNLLYRVKILLYISLTKLVSLKLSKVSIKCSYVKPYKFEETIYCNNAASISRNIIYVPFPCQKEYKYGQQCDLPIQNHPGSPLR